MSKITWRATSCLALTLLFATSGSSPANAADVRSLTVDNAVTIAVLGEIIDGDAARLGIAIDHAREAGNAIEITLDSIGGNVFEGVRMTRLVYAANVKTSVASGATCASICFLAFAAGHTKTVAVSARIGVHVASGEAGRESPESIAGTGAMARIAQSLDVPRKIIERMVSTHSETMFWLSGSDLRSMNVVISGDR